MKIAIIVPFLNEEQNIPIFLRRLAMVLQEFQNSEFKFQCILVNDGSNDNWLEKLSNLDTTNFNFKIEVLNLSRNFGHQNAIAAGYSVSNDFDAAITMDIDLQDPPEIIPEILREWINGSKVVLCKRISRKENSIIKTFLASLYYKTFKFFTGFDLPKNVGDFRLVDKVVISEINRLKESNQFYRGLIPWLGHKVSEVSFERDARFAGSPKYNFIKSLKLGINGVVSFSIRPLILFSILGFMGLVLTLFYGAFQLISILILGVDTVSGWATTVFLLLFVISIQFLTIGVLGIYIGRIYEESKGRPRYLIESFWKLNDHNR